MPIQSSSAPAKGPRKAALLLIASLHGLGLWALCQPAPAKLPPPRPLWLLTLAPAPATATPASAPAPRREAAPPRPSRTAAPPLPNTRQAASRPTPAAPQLAQAAAPDALATPSGMPESGAAQPDSTDSAASLPAQTAARPAPPEASDSPPRFDAAYLNNPAPAYPPLLRRAGEQGKVVLRVLVSAGGLAEQVELLRSSGQELFDQAALAAVRKWRFAAATRAGQAVAGWVQVPLEFRLR